MDRRAFLAAIPAATATFAADRPAKAVMGLVIHSYPIRGSKPKPPAYPPLTDPIDFVKYAAAIGAAGVQTRITYKDEKALARLAKTTGTLGVYIEGIVTLPASEKDVERFDAELAACKLAGADIARTVCMNGRRYETFTAATEFDTFVNRALASLKLAEPLAAKHKVRLAVENHKDWRVDEMTRWLKALSSEFVGVCLDTGNSISLLEDPDQTVAALAPYTFTTHIKDMAIAEYPDGFLLSEVPLGTGFLDLPKLASLIRKANPKVRLNLEMITRDPLKVPCLTEKYHATFGKVPARDLADTLVRVRRHQPKDPLPTISTLTVDAQLKREEANIAVSLAYAKAKLA